MIKELTMESFQEFISSDSKVLVDWYDASELCDLNAFVEFLRQ